MNLKELRAKAWESLKGKYWTAFFVSLVAGFLSSLSNGFSSFGQNLSQVVGLVNPSEMDSVMAMGAFVLNGVAINTQISAKGFYQSKFFLGNRSNGFCFFIVYHTS